MPVPVNQLLIGDVFTNAARAVPHRTAAVLGDRSLTFAEVDAAVDRVARTLRGLGVGRGERVVCWAGTTLDAVPLFAALARLGAIYAPVAGTLGVDEAAELAAAVRPALVVAADRTPAETARLGAAIGVPVRDLRAVVAAADAEAHRAAAARNTGPHTATGLLETDPHCLFFSSGSTGRPKGIVLSHRVSFLRSHPGSQLEPRGAAVCSFPLFHMAAWTISLQQWQARDTVVYLDHADGQTIRAAVQSHRAARLYCVPAVWQRVLDGDHAALATLRFADTGTSAVTAGFLDAIRAAAPRAHLRVFYGSTETGNVAALDGDGLRERPDSIGVPGTSTEVRRSGDGELQVRGPLLFDGYFDDPAATAAAFDDGWYRTGDLAEIDAAGRITLTGRLGELIRTGGETVVPGEVEAWLADHPAVADAAVVGLPDPAWGEVVCAVVVPRDPQRPPSLEDLRRHLDGRLAAHKHPRLLRVVDELPRTPATGQVRRRLIAQRIAAASPCCGVSSW
ncbi:class I adenylate-forming enzyme family protein [Streptomyces sp. NPDC020681]|uniref:class I adenylate-forming enzyme family protein n=1 Tax=Streptomyces sp. NPDC020681 TaxID=3365083 RepID=UPI00379615D4